MTTKKIEESTAELRKKIFELQVSIRKIKFGGKYKEKNVKKIRAIKKEIARALTAINARK